MKITVKTILKFLLINMLLLKFVFALTLDDRRKKIINIIDEELSEVSRLSKQGGHRNPDHLLRMAELYLEKARLWREKENQSYIALPAHVRRKTSKRKYFSKSAGYFEAANKLCLKITKKYKRYNAISDVYYILGFNAKEAGKYKTAKKYFTKANKKSRRNSITKLKSQISLAEIYYNKKQYRKAIPLYERALGHSKDKWWTKDSFNLAWCYFRSNKYSKAINKMKSVFSKSSNKRYIDMRSQVERDIGLIFATAGRIEEGISFYRKIGINFTDQLLRIAVTMKSKGQYSRANKTLKYALKYEKNKKRYAEIYSEQLDLFSKYGRSASHLATAQKMYKLYREKLLSSNQTKTLTYQAGRMAAILQKQVASKTYKRLKKQRKKKAAMAIAYFEILNGLESSKRYEYSFYQGETAFIMNNFKDSVIFYNKSFDHAAGAKVKNKTYMGRAMEGILSSLGQRRLSKKIKENNYVPVYEKYLTFYARGKRASSIYQKLFKVYFERKQYKKAKGILDRFTAIYKTDWKAQEAMIAALMEVSRKKKENKKIRAWIAAIDQGKYKVSKLYAKKLRELLTNMQIELVQMDLKKGNKKEALLGYHEILKDPHSTKKSKVNAKYNLAALYYEMGTTENAFEWSNKAIDEMSSKEASSFADSFLTISSFLFTRLEFMKSADLSKKILKKLCKRKSRKKSIAFKNSAYLYLAEKKLDKVKEIVNLGKKCKIPSTYIETVEFEMLKDYAELKAWTNYENTINILARKKRNRSKLIVHIDRLESVHRALGNKSKANKLNKKKFAYYRATVKSKKDIPLEALDIFAAKEVGRLKSLQSKILNTKLQFPFKTFQRKVGHIRKWLDRLIVNANKIQKIGSGNGIVSAYKILIDTHKVLANKFTSFKPKKMSDSEKASIKTFYLQMKAQAKELLSTAKSLQSDVWGAIERNQILSSKNTDVIPNNLNVAIRYWYPSQGVIMDRGGIK